VSRRWLVVALALFGAGFFVRQYPGHAGSVPLAVAANILIAATAWLAVRRWLGGRSAGLLVLMLAVYAYVIESVGVVTGVPYGSFSYGTGLGPLVLGIVPVLLPLAYVPLVLGAAAAAGRAPPGGGAAPIQRDMVIGTIVLVTCDLVLDPGAVRLGYWRYAAGGLYYGVPVSNFAGWLVSSVVAMGIVWWCLGRFASRRTAPSPPRDLATGALLVMAFWTGIGFWHGLRVPTLLGLAMVALFWSVARGSPARE
jgi:bisanhydrobacterioruberin hydratase